MKIRLLFTVFLMALSFILSANKTPQIDSINSQKGQETILPAQEKDSGTIMLVQEDNVFSEKDSGNLAQIRDNTKETADNTKKGGYETWTIILSALAFVTALVTLGYTYRTFKSQRQTEANTLAPVSRDIQRYLLNELIVLYFDSLLYLTALWDIVNQKKYLFYPNERLIRKIKVPTNTIFIELFYKNKYEYKIVKDLLDSMKEYNLCINELENHLKSKYAKANSIKKEFYFLIIRNNETAMLWGDIMTKLYGYDDKMKSTIFEEVLKNFSNKEDEEKPFNSQFYNDSNAYSNFLGQDSMKKKMLKFMDEKTLSYGNDMRKELLCII